MTAAIIVLVAAVVYGRLVWRGLRPTPRWRAEEDVRTDADVRRLMGGLPPQGDPDVVFFGPNTGGCCCGPDETTEDEDGTEETYEVPDDQLTLSMPPGSLTAAWREDIIDAAVHRLDEPVAFDAQWIAEAQHRERAR